MPSLNPDNIPPVLKDRPQWVNWRLGRSESNSGKFGTKIPVSANTMRNASVSTPESWSTFDICLQRFRSEPDVLSGVGFVFTAQDDFVGIDLDGCLDNQQTSTKFAESILQLLDSYTEISPSGQGVKCIVRAPGFDRSKRKSNPAIEIYSSSRFFTLTGQRFGTNASVAHRPEQMQRLVAELFPESNATHAPSNNEGIDEVPDDEILKRARQARNSSKFITLWNGRAIANNLSCDDLSLLRILAFWCGPNPEQIDRLLRRSNRLRPKWDRRISSDGMTYGEKSIAKAIEDQGKANYWWKRTTRERV